MLCMECGRWWRHHKSIRNYLKSITILLCRISGECRQRGEGGEGGENGEGENMEKYFFEQIRS